MWLGFECGAMKLCSWRSRRSQASSDELPLGDVQIRQQFLHMAAQDAKRYNLFYCAGTCAYICVALLRRAFVTMNLLPIATASMSLITHLLVALVGRCGKPGVSSCCIFSGLSAALVLDGICSAISNESFQFHAAPHVPPVVFEYLGPPATCPGRSQGGGGTCFQEGEGPLRSTIIFQLVISFHVLLMLPYKFALPACALCQLLWSVLLFSVLPEEAFQIGPLETWVWRVFLSSLQCSAFLLTRRKIDRVQLQLLERLAETQGQVVQERVLRFKSERETVLRERGETDALSRQSGGLTQTTGSTTGSEQVFCAQDPESIENLEDGALPASASARLLRLGKKEHWLMHRGEVQFEKQSTVLGSGSFGVVFKAVAYGAEVAVKIPLGQFHDECESASARDFSTRALAAYLDELRVLRYVRHPNIVTFFGAVVAETNFLPGLVLELVDGPSLAQFIRNQGSLETLCSNHIWARAAQSTRHHLTLRVASALWYLHTRNPSIIHGDLKPGNIGIQHPEHPMPCPKLLDFGLSRVLRSGAKPMSGTLRYMAPEVIAKDAQVPAAVADVFSFGCVSFFVSTGELPFSGFSNNEIRQRAARGRPIKFKWPESTDRASTAIFRPFLAHYRRVLMPCLETNVELRPLMSSLYNEISCLDLTREQLRLPPLLEEDEHGHDTEHPDIRHTQKKELLPTPQKTRLLLLLETMQSCHLENTDGCCWAHGLLRQLAADLTLLQDRNCEVLGAMTSVRENEPVQCPNCWLLLDADAGVDECNLCGEAVGPHVRTSL
eukprot:TRINITY_DN8511_c0_g1_i7.p1 TRINITY_DN8511_c0_g1~~TRINITY_DN8511_c0_g1_i7.p1  ORF type:complete len:780 (-),score=101.84 TRINITY_DN8511_c0_g1_i7:306-2645(-)